MAVEGESVYDVTVSQRALQAIHAHERGGLAGVRRVVAVRSREVGVRSREVGVRSVAVDR